MTTIESASTQDGNRDEEAIEQIALTRMTSNRNELAATRITAAECLAPMITRNFPEFLFLLLPPPLRLIGGIHHATHSLRNQMKISFSYTGGIIQRDAHPLDTWANNPVGSNPAECNPYIVHPRTQLQLSAPRQVVGSHLTLTSFNRNLMAEYNDPLSQATFQEGNFVKYFRIPRIIIGSRNKLQTRSLKLNSLRVSGNSGMRDFKPANQYLLVTTQKNQHSLAEGAIDRSII